MPIVEKYGLQILNGTKRYEIRTKPLRFDQGSRIWVYASAASRAQHVGAILGSFTYGGCRLITGPRALRWIAPEADASYAELSAYLWQRWPAWGLRVLMYERFRVPMEITTPGQGIRRLTDHALLRRLRRRAAYRPRRPLSRAATLERRRGR